MNTQQVLQILDTSLAYLNNREFRHLKERRAAMLLPCGVVANFFTQLKGSITESKRIIIQLKNDLDKLTSNFNELTSNFNDLTEQRRVDRARVLHDLSQDIRLCYERLTSEQRRLGEKNRSLEINTPYLNRCVKEMNDAKNRIHQVNSHIRKVTQMKSVVGRLPSTWRGYAKFRNRLGSLAKEIPEVARAVIEAGFLLEAGSVTDTSQGGGKKKIKKRTKRKKKRRTKRRQTKRRLTKKNKKK